MIIPREYVKGGENVESGDIITFLDAGVYGPRPNDPDEEMIWTFWVELPNGDRKKMTPNNTSLQTLKDAWGKMTEKWIKQQAKIKITEQMAWGKMRKIVWLSPAEGVATVKTAVPEPPVVAPPAEAPATPKVGPAFDAVTGEPLPGDQEIN